jgi:Conserved hypothetical protein 2217 (DUF2460)
MAEFPTLCSGAVAQYGSEKANRFSTKVCRFLDGGEQRYPLYGSILRQWEIRLDYLADEELSRLESFFIEMAGPAGQFQFTDPLDGLVYPSCSFDGNSLGTEYRAENRGLAKLRIKENRS